MEQEKLEFLKLDRVDRKILLWLLDNLTDEDLQSWVEHISDDYKTKKAIIIDPIKLYNEAQEKEVLQALNPS